MTKIQRAVENLVPLHGGLTPAAARETGIDKGYLHRLRAGLQVAPGIEVLAGLWDLEAHQLRP